MHYDNEHKKAKITKCVMKTELMFKNYEHLIKLKHILTEQMDVKVR